MNGDNQTILGRKNAGVMLRPPLLFAGVYVIALVVQSIYPLTIFVGQSYRLILGTGFVLIGGVIFGACLALFSEMDTPVQTHQPTRTLVTSGPFTRSRNPIYLSLFSIYIGLCFLMNSWWGFIFLPVIFLIMEFGVVRREERYLEETFGQAYRDYCVRVRRWL